MSSTFSVVVVVLLISSMIFGNHILGIFPRSFGKMTFAFSTTLTPKKILDSVPFSYFQRNAMFTCHICQYLFFLNQYNIHLAQLFKEQINCYPADKMTTSTHTFYPKDSDLPTGKSYPLF